MSIRAWFCLLCVFMSSPLTAAMIYVAGIEESKWRLQSSPIRCELRHAIPRYGEGKFVYSAGGELAFEISVMDPPMRDSTANLHSMPPFWKTGTAKQLGQLTLTHGKTPFYVSRDLAQRMLYELDAGMLPTLQYKDWGDSTDDVWVSLSSANFHARLPDFHKCISQLLPYGLDDLKDQMVEFDDNQFALTDEGKRQLDELSSYVVHDKKVHLSLSGHADAAGSRKYNKLLSEKRVKAVEAYLLKKGVSRKQLKLKSLGEFYPLASNDTEEGRRMNRRVLVSVVKS